ncbi:uncharacterized protein ACA1_204570 [Acanthamoeba castellanii str. Neff]|uniref:Ribosome biogenesis regulatory protein n=1 Tax=Acanthamoeba castellanii (strain ATCC 30010 / Neff) TaxID=1257118 RepID=L8GT40_ACACF|nr:uncharacterized protein ACA1_204570 [Acanthamoeba castellanii str. Neff]ELR16369.1 hypothetical protein ACA1_204570 [Acanthamoeba castellanii str. Neff]
MGDVDTTADAPLKLSAPAPHPDLLLGQSIEVDLGNLTGYDYQPQDLSAFSEKGTKAYLDETGRDAVQLLFNKLLGLPTHRTQEGDVLAQLPRPTTPLPREKHIPKPKPKTKWEQFAATKGIQKRKKNKLEWDETHQDWRRAHGYQRANRSEESNWVVEVKGNEANPHDDPFAKVEKEKKDRVKKQRQNEMRNMAAFAKADEKKKGLAGSIQHVNKSTASLGKFNERLPGEQKDQYQRGKRKFDDLASSGGLANEKERGMSVLNKILGKETAELNTDRAAKLALPHEAKKQKMADRKAAKGSGKGKGGGKGRKMSKK